MISKPIQVKAIQKYKIWIKYSDGTEGYVDLSHLSHHGIFKAWDEETFFNKVYIDKETDAIAWSKEIELCPNSLYLNIKGLTFEEWKSKKVCYASN